MKTNVSTVEAYLSEVEEEKRLALEQLRAVIVANLPEGFEEAMSYGMIGYVVPLRLYPAGYHCDPKQALPFVSIAAQKNYLAFYHLGMYMKPDLDAWFRNEYGKHSRYKLDMGKSCVRFKRLNDLPLALIAELMQKMSVTEFLARYEAGLKKS